VNPILFALDELLNCKFSNALSWILYQLSLSPDVQARLRAELLTVTSDTPNPNPNSSSNADSESSTETDPTPTLDALNELKYLDCVVREGLRLHSPVTSTMRVCESGEDVIPLSEGVVVRGKKISEIW